MRFEGVGRLWKVDEIAFRAEFLLRVQDNLIGVEDRRHRGADTRADRSRFASSAIAHREDGLRDCTSDLELVTM